MLFLFSQCISSILFEMVHNTLKNTTLLLKAELAMTYVVSIVCCSFTLTLFNKQHNLYTMNKTGRFSHSHIFTIISFETITIQSTIFWLKSVNIVKKVLSCIAASYYTFLMTEKFWSVAFSRLVFAADELIECLPIEVLFRARNKLFMLVVSWFSLLYWFVVRWLVIFFLLLLRRRLRRLLLLVPHSSVNTCFPCFVRRI